MNRTKEPSVWRGVVAGVAGGLLGSLVMREMIVGLRRARSGEEGERDLDQQGPSHQVADLVSRKTSGKALDGRRLALGGELVHYAFGAAVGAFYGGLSEHWQWTRWGLGSLFGTGVFLAADESSMPALGLVKKPWEESLAAQGEHLAIHLVFGVVSEVGRAAVRRML